MKSVEEIKSGEVTREKLNTGYVKSGEMNKQEKEKSREVTVMW